MPKILTATEVASFRDRLCDVAEMLFAKHGPDAVTVRQLAGELGVSPMTPYRYFKDKDAMLAAVRARAFDRFATVMEQACDNPPNQQDGGQTYIDFALAHPQAYTLMFDITQPTAAQHPELLQAMQRARATMSLGVRQLAGPTADEPEIERISHVFWSSMHGAIMLQLAGLLHPPLDARTILKTTHDLLMAGLTQRLSDPSP